VFILKVFFCLFACLFIFSFFFIYFHFFLFPGTALLSLLLLSLALLCLPWPSFRLLYQAMFSFV